MYSINAFQWVDIIFMNIWWCLTWLALTCIRLIKLTSIFCNKPLFDIQFEWYIAIQGMLPIKNKITNLKPQNLKVRMMSLVGSFSRSYLSQIFPVNVQYTPAAPIRGYFGYGSRILPSHPGQKWIYPSNAGSWEVSRHTIRNIPCRCQCRPPLPVCLQPHPAPCKKQVHIV